MDVCARVRLIIIRIKIYIIRRVLTSRVVLFYHYYFSLKTNILFYFARVPIPRFHHCGRCVHITYLYYNYTMYSRKNFIFSKTKYSCGVFLDNYVSHRFFSIVHAFYVIFFFFLENAAYKSGLYI